MRETHPVGCFFTLKPSPQCSQWATEQAPITLEAGWNSMGVTCLRGLSASNTLFAELRTANTIIRSSYIRIIVFHSADKTHTEANLIMSYADEALEKS